MSTHAPLRNISNTSFNRWATIIGLAMLALITLAIVGPRLVSGASKTAEASKEVAEKVSPSGIAKERLFSDLKAHYTPLDEAQYRPANGWETIEVERAADYDSGLLLSGEFVVRNGATEHVDLLATKNSYNDGWSISLQ